MRISVDHNGDKDKEKEGKVLGATKIVSHSSCVDCSRFLRPYPTLCRAAVV
jgi:hypothetical protein